MTREIIQNFLKKQAEANFDKSTVVANFTVYALSNGISIDKLGRIISDLRSYPEWKWGE